jgi:hypothetical protein
VSFEEILFLRIAHEYAKMYRHERSVEFVEHLERISLTFEEYAQVFDYLLRHEEE